MIEIIEAKDHGKIIPMSAMCPLAIGVICESTNNKGHIVMRTASTENFEIMDLTNPEEDSCWTDRASSTRIKVFIPTETVFTLRISNKK